MDEKVKKNKKIILTVDVEGPRGSEPIRRQIWGETHDGKIYGIPHIIDICDRYDIKGLFFVDVAEAWDLGKDKITEVIQYIMSRGHDVGVHIHPHHMPGENRMFLWEFNKEEQYKIIKQCTDLFFEITGELPKSFRAGKYGANLDTIDILAKLGYKYDFSEFYSQVWCGINPPIAYVLPQSYKSIVEFPVTIFKSFKLFNLYSRFDKLEVTINTNELKYIINEYAKSPNNEIITLFLHSFSLLDYLETPDAPRANLKNEKRFISTLEYISKCDDFEIISESMLETVNTKNIYDSAANIVKTKGFIRSLKYFILRAFEIRKTNHKAKLLFLGIYSMSFLIIAIITWLIFM